MLLQVRMESFISLAVIFLLLLVVGVSNLTKHEGDGCTPTGFLELRRLLYRSDRLPTPVTCVPCEPLKETDGWCDDSTHLDYNRQIHLPHPAGHEQLWLGQSFVTILSVY